MSTMIQNPNEIEAFTRRQRALARIHRNIAEKFQLNRRQFISGSLATMALAALDVYKRQGSPSLRSWKPKWPANRSGLRGSLRFELRGTVQSLRQSSLGGNAHWAFPFAAELAW